VSLEVVTRARASALLAGGAALSFIRLPGRAQTAGTIRIATLPIDSAAEVFYAKDNGFFDRAGLDAQIQILGPGAGAQAVVANAVDVGYAPIDALATAHEKRIPFVVIAAASNYLSTQTGHIAALVVPGNSPIRQAKDFNGKTIAASGLKSLAEYGPRAWIDGNGGDSSTAKFVELAFPEMPAALAANRVDAAWITEPFVTIAKEQSRILGYGFDSIAREFVISAWFTTSQWATDHPDLVRRFATVMRETALWANKNHARSGEVLGKYVKLDTTVVAAMTRSHYVESLNVATVQPLINVAAKYAKFDSFPAQELIYKPTP
jgi:NitT/TauT family transport system substrate-binding protein